MKKHECSPINNFYDDFLVNEPPFLKLHAVADIFVCEYNSGNNYKIVFEISDFKYANGEFHEWYEFKSCPNTIEWPSKLGGLSVKNTPQLTLTMGKDGGFNTFVCSQGKWVLDGYS